MHALYRFLSIICTPCEYCIRLSSCNKFCRRIIRISCSNLEKVRSATAAMLSSLTPMFACSVLEEFIPKRPDVT